MVWQLTALSAKARTYQGPGGGPDLVLEEQQQVVELGRSKPSGAGYALPVDWDTISNKHCRLRWSEEQVGKRTQRAAGRAGGGSMPPGAPVCCSLALQVSG